MKQIIEDCKRVEIEDNGNKAYKTINIIRKNGLSVKIDISYARLKGEWITNRKYIDKEFNGHYEGSCFNSPYNCSCCGYSPKDNRPNFCPNCGADMRKEADNETKNKI